MQILLSPNKLKMRVIGVSMFGTKMSGEKERECPSYDL